MKKKNQKKSFWKIVLIVSMIGLILILLMLGLYLYQDYKAQQEYDRLQKEMAEQEQYTVEELEAMEFTGESDGEETVLPDDIFLDLENPINFEKLQEVNEDIYAWIRIPDTNIDYPIVQRAGDDSFYLKRDIYKQPKIAGSIFTEECNSKDFTDPNTIIYGHNMKNKSMFQNLHLYEDPEFFKENPYVYIYTPDHVRAYKVFAAYVYDDRHLMHAFDFDDEEVFAQYLEDIKGVRSMYKNLRQDVEVTPEDHIITLVTCTKGQPRARYLVQAVLIKDEESSRAESGTDE